MSEAKVKERPILMSTAMVQAILAGRKTMTRRTVKPQPLNVTLSPNGLTLFDGKLATSKHGYAGDRLWVRETHLRLDTGLFGSATMYADDPDYDTCYPDRKAKIQLGWKVVPGIFMPRSASRITLEIIGVRCERLKGITEEDAIREGIESGGCLNCGDDPCLCANPHPSFRDSLIYIWNKLNPKYPWDSNPWVWVISFKRLEE